MRVFMLDALDKEAVSWDTGYFEALLILFVLRPGQSPEVPVGLRNLGAQCWLFLGMNFM